jgi:ribonuclease HI
MAWGYFDGAHQGIPGICGVGGLLFLNESHHVSFMYAAGQGANNRSEFCAL